MPLRLALLLVTLPAPALVADDWPQAAGPHGTFRVEGTPPLHWSVARNENVVWQTPLPEGGQSTVVVAGNRAFVTTHTPRPGSTGTAQDVVGHCLDATDGRVLWTCELPGTRPMKMAGIFSDSTSPSPIADGEHVWFFNASGSMGCWTTAGEPVWLRTWQPRDRHHSRQHEPILHDDVILFVEVRDDELGHRIGMHAKPPEGIDLRDVWTYVYAIDKRTGERLWSENVGTAIHNTPLIGRLADGTPAILHGRGGGHAPFEKPYGLSFTSLAKDSPGKTLWSYELPGGSSYVNAHWNARHAYWFDGNDHLVLDTNTGQLLSRTDVTRDVSLCDFDEATGTYTTREHVDLGGKQRQAHTNQTNIVLGDWHWFLAHDRPLVGRVHVESGRVEYLRVPVQVDRGPGRPDRPLWDDSIPIRITNTRGLEFATADKRSTGSGWGHVSAASPIAVGHHLVVPLMTGTTYVLDATITPLTEKSLVATNDLGPAGATWSLSSYSSANGRLYARTAERVVCIGK